MKNTHNENNYLISTIVRCYMSIYNDDLLDEHIRNTIPTAIDMRHHCVQKAWILRKSHAKQSQYFRYMSLVLKHAIARAKKSSSNYINKKKADE
jgi:hypothetical protein